METATLKSEMFDAIPFTLRELRLQQNVFELASRRVDQVR